jgi:hypothetical protein
LYFIVFQPKINKLSKPTNPAPLCLCSDADKQHPRQAGEVRQLADRQRRHRVADPEGKQNHADFVDARGCFRDQADSNIVNS